MFLDKNKDLHINVSLIRIRAQAIPARWLSSTDPTISFKQISNWLELEKNTFFHIKFYTYKLLLDVWNV